VPELEDEGIKYGVVKPIETYNPVKIAFVEILNIFKDASQKGLTLSQRFAYVARVRGQSR